MLRKLLPIIVIFALGIGTATYSVIDTIKAKNIAIENAKEALKNRSYEILKHETNYDDLHKRYDHVKTNYDNLGQQWEMIKDQRDNLREENKRLKTQVSRGKKRSGAARSKGYARKAPAGISRRRSLAEIKMAESG